MIYELDKNVKVLVANTFDYSKLLELKSVKQLIRCLNIKQPHNCYNYYFFWGLNNDEFYLLKEMYNIKKDNDVLFWIGDEEGYLPSNETFERFKFIFKVHLKDKDAVRIENGINIYREGLYHFPLLTIDDVPELPVIPFNKRKYNLYFSGNLNKNRLSLYRSLNNKLGICANLIDFMLFHNIRGGDRLFKLFYDGKSFDFSDKYYNSYLKFYSGFNNGSDYKTYAEYLQNSIVVLSPKGFYSTECFRLYEAMRQGCIVITEKLPKTYCYQDAPCILINSWKELSKVIKDIDELLETFNPYSIRDFYDRKLSVKGIADYIYAILEK